MGAPGLLLARLLAAYTFVQEGTPMRCPSCGFDNPQGFAFCEQCAAPLTAAPSMVAPSPQTYTPARFIEKILTSKTAFEGERKQVTVLFADLKGSMELLADRDPEGGGSSWSRSSSA
jgi:hypothetical protein